jgi:hypothetical protein
MEPVEPARGDPAIDRRVAEAEPPQLGAGHDAMPPPGEVGDRPLVGSYDDFPPHSGDFSSRVVHTGTILEIASRRTLQCVP